MAKENIKKDILKKSLIQKELISSIADIFWAWIAITFIIVYLDKDVSIFSKEWFIYILISWLILVEIFGVFNFLSRKIYIHYLVKQADREKRMIDLKAIRKAAIMLNIFWLGVLYFACNYTLELIKQLIIF